MRLLGCLLVVIAVLPALLTAYFAYEYAMWWLEHGYWSGVTVAQVVHLEQSSWVGIRRLTQPLLNADALLASFLVMVAIGGSGVWMIRRFPW